MTTYAYVGRRVAGLLSPERRAILSNSVYLIGTTIATSGLGFAYWWVAARRFSAEQVGVAAAAVSAMTLLGYVGVLGFGTLLIVEINKRRDRAAAYIATGVAVSGLAGIALGLAALLAAPVLSGDLARFAAHLVAAILFPLGVGLTAASLVVDHALIGLLRGSTQFARNATFAAGKLALLAVAALALGGASSVTIFATWVGGLFGSMLLVAALALRSERRLARYRPESGFLRRLGPEMLKHHTLNIALQAPNLTLPVLVATVLSAAAAGYFYAAWMMAGFVAVATPALGITLFAVGARSKTGLAHSTRLTLVVSFLLAGAGSLAAIVLGRTLLATFGRAYADQGADALVFLTLATLPGIFKTHFVQLERIHGRIGQGAIVVVAACILELSAAAIGAGRDGLVGLSAGYAAAVTLEAGLMAPMVLRAAELWPLGGGPRAASEIPGPEPPPAGTAGEEPLEGA